MASAITVIYHLCLYAHPHHKYDSHCQTTLRLWSNIRVYFCLIVSINATLYQQLKAACTVDSMMMHHLIHYHGANLAFGSWQLYFLNQ